MTGDRAAEIFAGVLGGAGAIVFLFYWLGILADVIGLAIDALRWLVGS